VVRKRSGTPHQLHRCWYRLAGSLPRGSLMAKEQPSPSLDSDRLVIKEVDSIAECWFYADLECSNSLISYSSQLW